MSTPKTKDSHALIRFVPLALNNAANWSASVQTPLDELRKTLQSVESKLESKLDRLLADNESLRSTAVEAAAENERLHAANAELAASVRLLAERSEASARMIYGLRGVEHAAREQRLLLRDLCERVERVEFEGGIGGVGVGMVGWGAREAIEGGKAI